MKLKHVLFFAASLLLQINRCVAKVTIGASTCPTLKAAFDDINNRVHTGTITATFSGTSESVPAVLNASGTGASNYSSIVMYPVAGVFISVAIEKGSVVRKFVKD
ncbi:MAG: hypothetical protein ABI855_13460 [Bacteroidota bacterium]